jgi:protoheme IX farnesyltransferase
MTNPVIPAGYGPFRQRRPRLRDKAAAYWTLIKDLQTGLLLITGITGYLSGRPGHWPGYGHTLLNLTGSLFLTIGGSTVLNMVLDRDIDAQMDRTADRPLPAGRVSPAEGWSLGLGMVGVGLLWALSLLLPYALVVLAGLVFDVLVYTVWLKRRTPWSIIWGGIAGGMPILAGRVLSLGRIDAVGAGLALAILLWIPTHIMTFSIKYADAYREAGVPVFPNRYGVAATKWVISLSTVIAVATMIWTMMRLGLAAPLLWAAQGLGIVLVGFTTLAMAHTTPKLTYLLYKLASLYMLGSMVVVIAGV